MHLEVAFPAPLLQPFINRYYQVAAYSTADDPVVDFTPPNGLTSLVFHFARQIRVSNVSYDGDNLPPCYILGKYTKPIFLTHAAGKADVFGVIFQPDGFHYFLGVPQQELTDQLVEVKAGLGPAMERVLDQMYHHPTLAARKHIMENFLVERLAGQEYRQDVVTAVLADIKKQNGKVLVKDVAKKYKVSPLHLRRCFLSRVGLGVKEYARTVRFNYALQAFASDRYHDLEQAALDFGYCDTPHLIKDFHHFTAGRPSDFLDHGHVVAELLMYS